MQEILDYSLDYNEIIYIVLALVSLLLSFLWLYRADIIRWFLKHQEVQWIKRWISLALAAILGMPLAYGIYQNFEALKPDSSVLHGSLTILALGLPTFFVLWLFRTHDVQRQINKTKENTNNSTLFECAKMLTEKYSEGYTKENSLSAKIALEQLAYLRREPGFDKERVNLITQGLSLEGVHLRGAHLSGLDLSRANLRKAHLEDANLSGTNLSGANLGYAYLQGTNLSNFVDDVKDKNKWQFASFDEESNFDNTWLESIEARGEAGMFPKERDESE